MKATQFSFGGTAAVVTNMALITGLTTVSAAKTAIVSGLLIVAVADNLTDSLSIHLYQESEHLEPRAAFRSTLTNFGTRLLLSLVFILIVLALPYPVTIFVSLAWGLGLLIALSAVIAHQRGVSLASEAAKHVADPGPEPDGLRGQFHRAVALLKSACRADGLKAFRLPAV